jgi:gamma-glutamyltranspeptidase/glutathione hydrolase
VYIEEGISLETVAKLRGAQQLTYWVLNLTEGLDMGHDARLATGFARGMMGRGQVIQKLVDASGSTVWAAGSDPRGDGHAAGHL